MHSCESEYDEVCQWFIPTQKKALNTGHTIDRQRNYDRTLSYVTCVLSLLNTY